MAPASQTAPIAEAEVHAKTEPPDAVFAGADGNPAAGARVAERE